METDRGDATVLRVSGYARLRRNRWSRPGATRRYDETARVDFPVHSLNISLKRT
jgi:hypothetical protein